MNTDDPINHKTEVALARLDERLKAMGERMEREERANQRAIRLASDELARRLDILNHSHSQMLEAQSRFMPRELYETESKQLTDRLQTLQSEFREQQGRLWLPLLVAAGAGAGLAAAAVRFLFS